MSNFSTDKWVIFLPKQPIKGIWYHKNDSFRELAKLWEEKIHDVKVANSTFTNCLLQNIVLYDRPTLEWITKPTCFRDLLTRLPNESLK